MEKIRNLSRTGFFNLFLGLAMLLSPVAAAMTSEPALIAIGVLLNITGIFWLFGLFTVQPNQTRVLLFFGKYKGTVVKDGFFWLNPFYMKKKVSLRVRNLETNIIKVNDELGNPILVSAVVVWKVTDTYKAIFNIEAFDEIDPKTGVKRVRQETSYQNFVKMQAEAALRKIAHSYPYDTISDDENSISLRSGMDEINKSLAEEIRDRLSIVGIEVLEARISNLSYAPEIAAVMLQRQQAQAIIAARRKIVEGSVGMVEMALQQMSERKIAEFTPEQKAAVVSNLLVVLCSDQSTTPVINTSH
jgi:regulator of protease activity HflC (stomatin/prohibitin superfamily)